MKEHRLPRRAKFVPTGSDCPVKVDQILTRLVAVRFTRIGRDMSFQAVRRRYTDGDAPGGSLMYEMHWDEIPMVGYVVMKFQDFRKAIQLQRMRQARRGHGGSSGTLVADWARISDKEEDSCRSRWVSGRPRTCSMITR